MRTLLLIFCISCISGTAYNQTSYDESSIAYVRALNENSPATQQKKFRFELDGGLIFVEAQLGQHKDNFILDTGAPTVVINSDFIIPDLNNDRAVGISGSMQIQKITLDHFSMNRIRKKNIKAIATDISHIERVKGRRIKGLIGYEMLRDHEILIDYSNQTITILDENDVRKVDNLLPVEEIKMKVKAHFPIIKIKIGKRKYTFGVDTGAEVNVMDINLYKKLRKYCAEESTGKSIQGVDKGKTKAMATKIKETKIKHLSFKNMDYVFADISYLNRGGGYKLDGILGYPFLKQAKFSLNYNDNKLYIWKALPVIEEFIKAKDTENLLTSKTELIVEPQK